MLLAARCLLRQVLLGYSRYLLDMLTTALSGTPAGAAHHNDTPLTIGAVFIQARRAAPRRAVWPRAGCPVGRRAQTIPTDLGYPCVVEPRGPASREYSA
jgi:hypothetical protein